MRARLAAGSMDGLDLQLTQQTADNVMTIFTFHISPVICILRNIPLIFTH